METPFRSVDVATYEPISRRLLDADQANLQWLYENTPRERFYAEDGTYYYNPSVIVCGRVDFSKSKKESKVTKRVNLGKAFHSSCQPDITLSLASPGAQDIFLVLNGPNNQPYPNHTGFDIVATVMDDNPKDKWKISKPFSVYWQARGYRPEETHEF